MRPRLDARVRPLLGGRFDPAGI